MTRVVGSAPLLASMRPGSGVRQAAGHRDEHRELRQVGRHLGRRQPLGARPRYQRAPGEPGRHRDRGAARPGRDIPGVGRQFLDPGRAGAEGQTARGPGQESAGVQQQRLVTARHQQAGGEERHQQRRPDDGAAPDPVRQRAPGQQRGDQPERVEREHRVDHGGREPQAGLVHHDQRGELVRAPPDGGQREPGPEPCPARHDGRCGCLRYHHDLYAAGPSTPAPVSDLTIGV